jgi:hypothetical protein
MATPGESCSTTGEANLAQCPHEALGARASQRYGRTHGAGVVNRSNED